jgi:hypothetical protein
MTRVLDIPDAGPIVCDDCRQLYDQPVYYTLGGDPDDPESMGNFHDDGSDCTDNLCPSCAGPYLEPDDPNDPRRQEA